MSAKDTLGGVDGNGGSGANAIGIHGLGELDRSKVSTIADGVTHVELAHPSSFSQDARVKEGSVVRSYVLTRAILSGVVYAKIQLFHKCVDDICDYPLKLILLLCRDN